MRATAEQVTAATNHRQPARISHRMLSMMHAAISYQHEPSKCSGTTNAPTTNHQPFQHPPPQLHPHPPTHPPTYSPHPPTHRFKPSLDLLDGISFGHAKEFIGDPIGNLKSLFYRAPDSTSAASAADVYIFTCITTIELPGVRAYIDANVGSKVALAWNLELDTLRADLGLPGWPAKELHLNWLSTFKPAFYLRPRDYSKSVSVAPFIINYSGALLREYPGPWQVRRGLLCCLGLSSCAGRLVVPVVAAGASCQAPPALHELLLAHKLRGHACGGKACTCSCALTVAMPMH